MTHTNRSNANDSAAAPVGDGKLNWGGIDRSIEDMPSDARVAEVKDERHTYCSVIPIGMSAEQVEEQYRATADYDGAEQTVPLSVRIYEPGEER